MKYGLLIMLMVVYTIQNISWAQTSQTIVSLESRIGYSTNTYLNPFVSEWDPSAGSGYGVVSLLGQRFWYQNGHSVEATGGLVVEPFFEARDSWKGGLGMLRYRKRFSSRFSGGVEAGVSYFTSSFDRMMGWLQPSLTWFAGPFSLVRIKGGSNFRSYGNYADSLDTNQRLDLYALEFETWPSFQWHVTAGLYGQIKSLPSVREGFSSALSVGYLFKKGAQIRVHAGLEQYQQSVTTTTTGGPGPGFPPIGRPTGGSSTQTETETNRIIRLGLSGDYPLTRRWSVFVRAERLEFYSTQTAGHSADLQVSGGVRFSFEPGLRRGKGSITPEWNKRENEQMLRIHYQGKGRLYLTGDFNDWKRPGIPLARQSENAFVVRLALQPGAYEYKILRVNGSSEEWVEISNDSYTVSDGFGGKNALLLVE